MADTTAQRRGMTLSPAELFVLDQWGRQLREAFGDTPYLVGSAERGENYRDVDVRMILPWPEDTMSGLAVYTINVAISWWGRQVTGLPIDFQMQAGGAFSSYDGESRSPLGGRSVVQWRGIIEFALGIRDGVCVRCGKSGVTRRCCDHPLAEEMCAACYEEQQDGADPIECVHKADTASG